MKPKSKSNSNPKLEPTANELGYAMPAEWLPHDATWLAWPHNATDWPGRFGPIPWVYGEIVRHIVAGERVQLLVRAAAEEKQARRVLGRLGVPLDRVQFRRFPTNRVWARDFGPIFVRRQEIRKASSVVQAAPPSSVAIVRFRFNAWAKYPDWQRDDKIPGRAAVALGIPLLAARTTIDDSVREVVLEGGAIDVNGDGTLLTTEECLLDPLVQVRNPGFSRQDYQRVFREQLGITHTIWLGRGITGDDTHGHVDDLARFVNPTTIVLCREKNPADANHRPLEENWERLASARLADGRRPEVVALPMPAPVIFDGQRLPASYANFYICNAAVLVPTFNDPNDRVALGTLVDLFRDRPVIGVHAMDLVWGLGTLHCLSQQQPA